MADPLQDYMLRQGHQLAEMALRRVVGKAPSFVTQEHQYRQTVVQHAWEALPLPIRRLMKNDFARWDQCYQSLRAVVYDLNGAVIVWKPDAALRIATVLRHYYATEQQPTHAAIPVATPVIAQSNAAIPVAQPVRTDTTATSQAEATHEIAVGIDLGTTYSLVAYVDASGRPCTIPNSAGSLLTPSVVLFDEGGTVVGKEAVQASMLEPDKVADFVKRDMGAKCYRKKINGELLPPEVISSLILRSVKADAERKLGTVRKAVITVPAYFEETRRRATMDAGRLAGLEVLDIINEPTAAAIAYGYQLGFLDRTCKLPGDKPLRVLVYDLGGGTFDVTLVAIQGQEFTALATDGDVCLGGKDWDDKLLEIAAERFRQQCGEDPCQNPLSRQELVLAAEAAKRTLTERRKATLMINHMGTRMKVDVTREEFEEATAALLERTRMTAELVVRHAGLTWAEVDRVLLVGGSTRMPMVPAMLQQLTGKAPDGSIAVDEAVAQGAALYAELLAPRGGSETVAAPFSVTNVNSHSLGIQGANMATRRKVNKILIPRNSTLPRTVKKIFKTSKANQRSVQIKVLEGESARPEICTAIGVCAIRELPPKLPAGWPVLVSYTYEANGRLHVAARVKGCKAGVITDFQRENGMADEDLDLWSSYIEDELRDLSE